ncbi:MAG: hypothetical protein ACRDBL_05930 [Rhabdaerophilum sp.]
MNLPLFFAGLLAVLLGLAHSIAGEHLIFRGLKDSLARSEGRPVLSEQRVRVLRGAWHLVTIFGFALGALLIASSIRNLVLDPVMIIGVTMVVSGLFWALATRGRHPAWMVLFAIAGLCFWGA